MKRSSKKLISKSNIGLPNVSDVTTIHEIDFGFMPGAVAMQIPSSYTAVFAECYDALLWMNENIKQLDRMLDRLI